MGNWSAFALVNTAVTDAAAGVFNPDTGDINAYILWIVIAALAVSAVVLVVLAVLSMRRKKKRK